MHKKKTNLSNQANMGLFFAAVLQLCFIRLDASNILFMFFPIYSHFRGSLHVATELASRGHVIWNALPTQMVNDKRLQTPGVNNVAYRSLDDYDLEKLFVDIFVDAYLKDGNMPLPFREIREVSDKILRDTSLSETLSNLKLDLIILDSAPLARMLTVIAYKLDVPYIFVGVFFEPYASRTPFVLSVFPFHVLPQSPVMDLKTRTYNTIFVMMYWIYDPFAYYRAVEIYAPEKPYITLESLTAKALLWLIEVEPLLHYPQATLPNVKFVGSLSTSRPKPLPQPYKKFMDNAKEGVVIVSFGSIVKKLPNDIFEKFLDAFSRIKYKVIFKADKKMSVNSNVMLTEWMPQADLLTHPNTKLFITHCGANGQNEAFLNALPMIGFPMFAEQHFNAERVVYKGFGLKMDLLNFKADELVTSINLAIQNSSYSKKIKKAAEITKLRQRSPKEEAVYWIEHVLQYGGDHMRSYCQDMPLYQYLNLDVIGLLLFLLHLSLYLLWKLCYMFCIKFFCGSPEKKTKKD